MPGWLIVAVFHSPDGMLITLSLYQLGSQVTDSHLTDLTNSYTDRLLRWLHDLMI